MQEYVRNLNGSFELDSRPAEGCTVSIAIPLASSTG
jgi:signal transduction histidine kinase